MPAPKAQCRARGGPGRWQKRAKRLLSLGGWQMCNNTMYNMMICSGVRPGDVLAEPELALCGWTGLICSLFL